MIHTVYLIHEKFENVIEKQECDIETFLLDPEIIAEDYVIFIDKGTKERAMLKVLYSEFKDRRNLKEKLNVNSDNEAVKCVVKSGKELEHKKIRYKIKTEESMSVIAMSTKDQTDEIDEFTVVVVSEKGICVELKKKRFSFPKIKTNIGQNICEALSDTLYGA